MVTVKQMQFAQGIVSGKTQYQSYMDAYDPKTQTRSSIDVMAYKEAHKPEVAAYIAELKRRKEEQAVFTGFLKDEDKRAIIKERIEECRIKGDDASIARYIDILNKMDGVYSTGKDDKTNQPEPLAKLTDDQLKALLSQPDDGSMVQH